MKRNVLIIVGICCLFLFAGQVNAQKEEYNKAMRYRHMPYEKQVEEVLTNITDSQREALHKLSKENKDYMEKYRTDRKRLEDAILALLQKTGDNSEVLFPLIEMKNNLETEKEKRMYKMKLEIDSILTPEQKLEMDKYEAKKREEYMKIRKEIDEKCREKRKGNF